MGEPRYTYERVEDDPDDDIRGFPHLFNQTRPNPYSALDAVIAWCAAQFGPTSWRDPDRWMQTSHGAAIWIRGDQDAFDFRMRWC